MNTNGRMEEILECSNMEMIEYIRPTKHWTTIVAIFGGTLFFGVGLFLFLYTFKNKAILELFIFSLIFIIAGGAISIKSLIDYFIRPKNLFFRATATCVCWSGVKKKQCIEFTDIKRIEFFVDGTNMDSIYFLDSDGKRKKYINNQFLTESQLMEIYQYITGIFSGEVVLNGS